MSNAASSFYDGDLLLFYRLIRRDNFSVVDRKFLTVAMATIKPKINGSSVGRADQRSFLTGKTRR